MTANLRRMVKKNYGDAPNSLVCTLGKEITKKRNVYAMRVTFHPCAVLTPLNPSYPLVPVGFYGRRNHSCTISAQSVQGLGSYGNPKFPFPIGLHSDHDPYNS